MLQVEDARPEDAPAIAAIHAAVAADLHNRYGKGHWSNATSEKAVLSSMKTARILVGSDNEEIIATLTLATRKPWAIDVSYFTPVDRALYLTNMAVAPAHQRRGVGRKLLEVAERMASSWPADAIRLDAYDSAAGAGGFYAACGYRETGRVVYRGNPLVYYEQLLSTGLTR